MDQTGIDEYESAVNANISEYLSRLPSPFERIEKYLRSDDHKDFTLEMFDIASMTALIRSHKDTKGKYEVNAYLLEMLSSMFRVANNRLGWMQDEEAQNLTSMLAYDGDTESGREALEYFAFCCRQFPYSLERAKEYAYLMPIFAYSKQYKFRRSNYFARYMASIICRYNLTLNRGEHSRDITVDQLKCIPTLRELLVLCLGDTTNSSRKERYWLMRNVIIEYARIFLGALLQRSATKQSYGKIAGEVVSYHYVLYQEITQAYTKQIQEKEKPHETT